MVVLVSIPVLESGDGRIHEACWPARLAELADPKVSKRLCLINKLENY